MEISKPWAFSSTYSSGHYISLSLQANVLINAGGRARITDFSLAIVVLALHTSKSTSFGGVAGSFR